MKEDNQHTAFEQAVLNDDLAAMRRLTEVGKSVIAERCRNAQSLLLEYLYQLSCRASDESTVIEVVRLLLAAGDDVNAFDGDGCETPLLLATELSFYDLAALLVQMGAHVNVTNESYPETPLTRAQAAARNDNAAAQRCAEILLQHGAVEGCIMHAEKERGYYTEQDFRLLHAVLHQNAHEAQLALAAGANANLHAAWSVYLFEQALAYRSRALVTLLWQAGAKHAILTEKFYRAVDHDTENAEFIRFLLNLLTPEERGDINTAALRTAIQRRHKATATMLQAVGIEA